MAGKSELTPERKEAVGKSTDTTTYEVTSLGIRTFCRAVGYENPLYFDDEAASKAGHSTIIAPPGYLGMPVWAPTAHRRQELFKSPFHRNLKGGATSQPCDHVYAGDIPEANH